MVYYTYMISMISMGFSCRVTWKSPFFVVVLAPRFEKIAGGFVQVPGIASFGRSRWQEKVAEQRGGEGGKKLLGGASQLVCGW